MNNIINNKKYPGVNDKLWMKKHSSGDYLVHFLAYQNDSLLISILNKHKDLVLAINKDGMYLHHILAYNSYYNLLFSLFKKFPYVIDLIDESTGNHLLHLINDSKILQKVLDMFPNIEINLLNKDGMTPIMMSIENKDLKSFTILSEKASLNVSKDKSEACLILKKFKSKLNLTKSWFEIGFKKDLNLNKNSNNGEFPLLVTYLDGELDTLDYLIKHGADINNGGYGKNYLLFLMASRRDWKSIKKYINLLDFSVRNLKWNDVLMHFLYKVKELNSEEFEFLFSKIENINQQNVDGNNIFHLIPNELILEKKDLFIKQEINIWATNNKNISILDKWSEDKKNKNKLINIWYQGYKGKLNKTKLYDTRYLKQLKMKDNLVLPDSHRNHNNIYSAYIDNLIIYVIYIIEKWNKELFIPMKYKSLKLNFSKLDSYNAKIIKYRIDAKENLSIVLNNFIEYYDNNTYYLPDFPDKFSKISFYILSIIGNNVNHTNIIIIDTYNKLIERFDPEGYYNNDIKMDQFIEKKFKKHKQLKKYDYIPKYSNNKVYNSNLYQLIEVALDDERPGDPVGFCSAWCLWYLELRLKNPTVNPQLLYDNSLRKIFELNYSIRDYIRSYSLVLVKYKNSFITKILGNQNRNKDYFSDEDNQIIRSKIDKKLLMVTHTTK